MINCELHQTSLILLSDKDETERFVLNAADRHSWQRVLSLLDSFIVRISRMSNNIFNPPTVPMYRILHI